ncbi:MAG: ATP synthase F1 subunit delta, partial [Chloroflexota bacterium]|nr:ATP synthase F1 subunit delta [Chloroflexota bacterium]
MLRGSAARRYAESVFAIAKEANNFDRWLEDLATMETVFTQPDMARFLADPKPAIEQKEAVVDKLLSGRVGKLALNLAYILLRRAHAAAVPGLRRELQRLVNEERNVAVAQVTTAVELDKTQAELVKQRLAILTAKNIELKTSVDKSILGGFVARVGDVLID